MRDNLDPLSVIFAAYSAITLFVLLCYLGCYLVN